LSTLHYMFPSAFIERPVIVGPIVTFTMSTTVHPQEKVMYINKFCTIFWILGIRIKRSRAVK
uniref:Bestrophin homolog n=1 Tax=Brugia timori TaxID=42155 RepID=A0A0R3Q4Z1_9BILA